LTWWAIFGDLSKPILAALIVAAILAVVRYLWVQRQKAKRKFAFNKQIRRFLERTIVNNSTLAFGDPSRTSTESASTPSVIMLGQVWTPLRASAYYSGGEDARPVSGNERFLDDIVADLKNPHILILGEPGSGKSTAVAHLTVKYAKDELMRQDDASNRNITTNSIPVRVTLRDVRPSNPPQLEDFWSGVNEIEVLRLTKVSEDDLNRLKSHLEKMLRVGKGALLMDGLDEVKEENILAIQELINLAKISFSQSMIVITCRKYDYGLKVPNRKINVPLTLELLPFTPDDAEKYVRSWYTAVVSIGRLAPNVANARRDKLLSILKQNKDLMRIGSTPLLLTLLTLVHTEEGELPRSRALVYERAIKYMLAETPQWRQQAGGATVASAEMMDLAQHVAYKAHGELEKSGVAFRGITREELMGIVTNYFQLHDQPIGAAFDSVNKKVTAHLLRLIQSNGLLQDQGGNRFAFAHRSFQEFLAGQYFSQGSHHDEALECALKSHWREPFKLLAGFAAQQGKSLFYVLKLILDLSETPIDQSAPTACRARPILAGEMLLEIGQDALAKSGYKSILSSSPSVRGQEGLWVRLSPALLDDIQRVPAVLPASERIRALVVIGGLNDPRFLDTAGVVRSPETRLVVIRGGLRVIGSPSGSGEDDERPQRSLRFSDFSIGRYLVTNLEYGEFIREGGYKDKQWWHTEEARRWIEGDLEFLKEVRRLWVETLPEYHAKEVRDKEIPIQNLEAEAELRCQPRSKPFYWDDERFNGPNQPVVGITWWEARAYCAWLTDKGRRNGWLLADEIIRLPSEFEWEVASRPSDDGRVYPWGNDWDHEKAHTREDGLNMRASTPVGAYPEGTWPGGPLDLSGNVWEWLENQKMSYDIRYDVDRMELSGLGDRAIKGSSWYNTPKYARCNARFVDRPYNLYYDVGFRVLRVKNNAAVEFLS